ncbi:MAG TPA: biotin/lipoyl-binding protein [Opitutaceae bacterium]|nr:biotin/lipoyl-binding protein [Opitutaceae bacterium]
MLASPSAADINRRIEAIVPSPLRADIIIRRQFFKHQEYYVLKDPLALTYFRLLPEETYILTQLDGKRTLGEIAARFNARYPNQPQTALELAQFVNQLGAGGLLNISAARFVESANKSAPQQILMLWAKLISTSLFVKVPLIDPSEWLGSLAHAIRFVWTKWFVGAALLFYIWTAGLLLVNADQFSVHRIDFFSASNLIILWFTIIAIKTLHEFGHATTCRHFGGEVHEMGMALLCFTPCGYVDASDAWMMRHQRHKLFTTIAGVFTELILACIAAHFWLFLPDGLARNVAFNAMLVASVNTIVFNINPLMRFDGYYVLCDLLEIPNLRSKAISFCSYHLQRVLLGYRNANQEAQFSREANGRVFIFYAIAAYLYMISIIYGFTQIFGRVLEPIGLHDFGLSLGFFVEGSFVALPFIKVIMDASRPGAHIVKSGSSMRRALLISASFAALVTLSFFVPSHHHVTQQAIVTAHSREGIASNIGGTVKQVHVHTGQWVNPGDLLLTLDNPEISADLRMADLARQQALVKFSSLRYASKWAVSETHASAAQEMEVAEAAYQVAAARAAKLEIHAKVGGYVLTPDAEKLVGTYAEPYALILRIGDTRQLQLIVPLTEDEAQMVSPGDKVTGRWVSTAERFETALDAVSSQPAKPNELQSGMLAYFGGPVPMQMLQRDARDRPDYPIFLATAPLPKPGYEVPEGLRVRITIEGEKTTVGRKAWRAILSWFNLKSKKPMRR